MNLLYLSISSGISVQTLPVSDAFDLRSTETIRFGICVDRPMTNFWSNQAIADINPFLIKIGPLFDLLF